jgi:hypothetical protein
MYHWMSANILRFGLRESQRVVTIVSSAATSNMYIYVGKRKKSRSRLTPTPTLHARKTFLEKCYIRWRKVARMVREQESRLWNTTHPYTVAAVVEVMLTSSVVKVSFVVQLLIFDLSFPSPRPQCSWTTLLGGSCERTNPCVGTFRIRMQHLDGKLGFSRMKSGHHLLRYHRCTNKRSANGGRRRKDRPLSGTSTNV